MTIQSDRSDGRTDGPPEGCAADAESLTKSNPANHDRREITLLLRGIRDEFWVSVIRQSTDDLMGRFSQYPRATAN